MSDLQNEAGEDLVLYEVKDEVALLTLNRPERNNAWTNELGVRLFERLDQAAADAAVRVIVLTGTGRSFSPGADMGGLQGAVQGSGSDGQAHELRPLTYPRSIPKPIVVAINGACAGISLAFALMCEIRIAAAGVKLTTAFARRGLIAEHGMSWTLPRIVGPATAMDLLLSGRVVLAEEAKEIGLVNKVLPRESFLEQALDYARDLATHSASTSMAVMKKQIYDHLEMGIDEALADSNRLMAEAIEKPDFREGVTSFVEKRPPNFERIGK